MADVRFGVKIDADVSQVTAARQALLSLGKAADETAAKTSASDVPKRGRGRPKKEVSASAKSTDAVSLKAEKQAEKLAAKATAQAAREEAREKAAVARLLKNEARKEAAAKKAADRAEAVKTKIANAGAATRARIDVGALGDTLEKLGGPAGKTAKAALEITDKFGKMRSGIGLASSAVLGATAITIALGTALALAASSVLKFAVKTADLGRTQLLLDEGITKSVAGGKLLSQTVNALADELPVSTDRLREMAKELIAAGTAVNDLPAKLRDTATAAAQAEYGPNFLKATLALPNVLARVERKFTSIFSALRIDGVLAQLNKVADYFDDSNVAGQALRTTLTTFVQPLIDLAANYIPTVVRGFLQFQIVALQALIAVQPYQDQIATGMRTIATASLVVVGIVGGALAVTMAVATGIFYATATAITFVVDSIAKLVDLASLGANAVSSFANGILGGGVAVSNAMTSVANQAIQAGKNALGIASPSKVGLMLGSRTAEGVSLGLEDGTNTVSAATQAMLSPITQATAPTAPVISADNSRASTTVSVTINVNGGSNGKETAQNITEALTAFFETRLSQLGGLA